MENYLKCENCKQISKKIFENKCCGDLYCCKCKVALINKPCLKCNSSLHFEQNFFSERILNFIQISCKFGCGIKLKYEEMQNHLLKCQKKIFKCSFDKCEYEGKHSEILLHFKQKHEIYLLILMENYENFKTIISKIFKGEEDDETVILNANSIEINSESSENDFYVSDNDPNRELNEEQSGSAQQFSDGSSHAQLNLDLQN